MACKKARGKRAKTRHSHTKKGSKVTVNTLLQQIPLGARVDIRINPAVHSGIPFRRYQGMTGTVVGRQGKAYYVAVSKLGKAMKVLAGPAHLNLSRGSQPAGISMNANEDDGKVAA
ncbi:50S ribosomal protein L21e [uncultured archaeon]|nr:50S ribosomal protein L21e [uncultured archaeon]